MDNRVYKVKSNCNTIRKGNLSIDKRTYGTATKEDFINKKVYACLSQRLASLVKRKNK